MTFDVILDRQRTIARFEKWPRLLIADFQMLPVIKKVEIQVFDIFSLSFRPFNGKKRKPH